MANPSSPSSPARAMTYGEIQRFVTFVMFVWIVFMNWKHNHSVIQYRNYYRMSAATPMDPFLPFHTLSLSIDTFIELVLSISNVITVFSILLFLTIITGNLLDTIAGISRPINRTHQDFRLVIMATTLMIHAVRTMTIYMERNPNFPIYTMMTLSLIMFLMLIVVIERCSRPSQH